MNFFQRRKLLKKINSLELTPVRVMDHEIRDDGGVSIRLPRFKNTVVANLFHLKSKADIIPIRLDRFGSYTWLFIDGSSNVAQICSSLMKKFPDELSSSDETATRVTSFIARLYQERYVTFRELDNK